MQSQSNSPAKENSSRPGISLKLSGAHARSPANQSSYKLAKLERATVTKYNVVDNAAKHVGVLCQRSLVKRPEPWLSFIGLKCQHFQF